MKNVTQLPQANLSRPKLSRRGALKKLVATAGAIGGTAALPAMVLAGDNAPTSAAGGAAETQGTEPALERYGIRQRQAPEIVLDYWIDANGEPTEFSVKQQEGKWLFMKFFQNWCPGCHSMGFPTLQKFVTAFKDNPKVTAIAVQTVFEGFSHNSQDAVRELQLRYDLPIVMGHDPGTELTDNLPLSMLNYRTGGTPWLILVSPDGQVIMNDFHVNADSLIEFVQKYAV